MIHALLIRLFSSHNVLACFRRDRAQGVKNMTKAATNLNKSSSRAHTVFTLTYTYKKFDERQQPIDIKRAQINLIDLAGSERVAKTGCMGGADIFLA